jgi:outer membrane protein OmpA-like peptidoglycan-associated protein
LEDGDVNAAIKRAGEAEKLFRQAELEAIKLNYLNETLTLLQQAEEFKVDDYAPETLAKAVHLVTQAERELNENRYDTDVARSLARQAKYEAEHAIYLSKIIEGLRDDEELMEKYLLATEIPLDKIASTLDIVGSFEAGFEITTKEVITKIQALQEKATRVEQDLAERERQVELLNSRVNELEEALGGVEQEKSKLAQQMEAQANIRAQFASVEQLFSREEAQVLRKRDDVIIRLIMLTFPVGKATIEPQNFALLTKVQRAITMFPECDITVEGHTDSYGGDELNMTLSQDRANAVSQYLLANMGIARSRISAVGYGEGRPIANNETVEGRTKNRRIEVIIHPKF